MNQNSRQGTMFALEESYLSDFNGHPYPGRSYSSASSASSSDYWNYGPPSTRSSLEESIPYDSRKERSWSRGSSAMESPPIPHGYQPYHTSVRTTDFTHHNPYAYGMDVWSSPHISPSQSSEFTVSGRSSSSWSSGNMSYLSMEESKPILTRSIIPPSQSCSPISTLSSLSPSPPPIQRLATSTPPSGMSRLRKPAVVENSPAKECAHCHATSTPLWRREPSTLRTLCNACGLYLQQRNRLRPQELIDADNDDDSDDDSQEHDGTGPECSHCHTRNTSVWRRSKTGAQLCNACGVYARLKGKDRPLSLRRNKIKPRTKHGNANKSSVEKK